MENLFNKLLDSKDLVKNEDIAKEKIINDQAEFIVKEIDKLTDDNSLILNFAVVDKLRHIFYRKGYNIVVNGNESILSKRDPKEDMIDEWTTFDCGN